MNAITKVLVTGNLGYIGRVMSPFLRRAGYHVTGLDTGWFANSTFGREETATPTIRKDLREIERDDLKGFDAIVHLAGICNDPMGDLNPQVTMEVNYFASLRLAEIAREVGVRRFVFSSSCSIYGGSGDEMLDESAPVMPLTVYARSKTLLEDELSKLANDSFCPVYLRNATAYGASPGLRLDLVLNDFVASAVLNGRILIKSDGTPWRPIVHIEDISRAFRACLDAPEEAIYKKAFNVGSTSENYRISDLAEIVKETVPGCSIEYAPGGGPDKRCYRVNCDKIRAALPQFRTRWTARKGAEQLYEAYQQNPLTPEKISAFGRLAEIRRQIAAGTLDEDLRRMPGRGQRTRTAGQETE
jgi:nucleoside-diphosphate-sugar epimerase